MKVLNQYVIKNANLREIYERVQNEEGISRATIAKQLKLSKTTVSQLTEELIAAHFVRELGHVSDLGVVGRSPTRLGLQSDSNFIAVAVWKNGLVDMRLVDAATGTLYGQEKEKPGRRRTKDGSGAFNGREARTVEDNQQFAGLTYDCFEALSEGLSDRQRVLGTCVVIPALIDREKMSMISTPLQLDWNEGKQQLDTLHKKFWGRSLCILNDTACLTYAEAKKEDLKDTDFAYINFSIGIGAALYIQNKILGGATGAVTQFGHFSIDPNGLPCHCGGHGCLEAMMGEKALAFRWGADICVNETLNYRTLREYAETGNSEAQAAIQQMADEFSFAIVNMIVLFCPKRIIIGGRGVELGGFFLKAVKENLKHMGFPYMVDHVCVSFTQSLPEEIYMGAAHYFMHEYYDYTGNSTAVFFLG